MLNILFGAHKVLKEHFLLPNKLLNFQLLYEEIYFLTIGNSKFESSVASWESYPGKNSRSWHCQEKDIKKKLQRFLVFP